MTAVVIVGAGQAGFQAATSLRDQHFDGTITLIGDETELPYQRPPLSKAYLAGTTDEAGLHLRPHGFFADRDIAVLTNETVTGIDRAQNRVATAAGKLYPYDHLILATGARNRTLPGEDGSMQGVLMLRTLKDAALLKAKLDHVGRVVVLGAGFIGLEFAAVAAKRGLAVTVVEMAERPMARALSPAMSGFFRSAHEAMGVVFRFGAKVTAIVGEGGHATGVALADGTILPADLVLVGIGVIPNAELAAAAGLAVSNGIVVDETLATADPAISAIGDCAFHPFPLRTRDAAAHRIRAERHRPGPLRRQTHYGDTPNPMRPCRGSGATRVPTSCRSSASARPGMTRSRAATRRAASSRCSAMPAASCGRWKA